MTDRNVEQTDRVFIESEILERVMQSEHLRRQ